MRQRWMIPAQRVEITLHTYSMDVILGIWAQSQVMGQMADKCTCARQLSNLSKNTHIICVRLLDNTHHKRFYKSCFDTNQRKYIHMPIVSVNT